MLLARTYHGTHAAALWQLLSQSPGLLILHHHCARQPIWCVQALKCQCTINGALCVKCQQGAAALYIMVCMTMSGSLNRLRPLQGELAIKDVELVAANREAEKLLKEISESTAVAEKEKHKVALIVEEVSKTAKVGSDKDVPAASA